MDKEPELIALGHVPDGSDVILLVLHPEIIGFSPSVHLTIDFPVHPVQKMSDVFLSQGLRTCAPHLLQYNSSEGISKLKVGGVMKSLSLSQSRGNFCLIFNLNMGREHICLSISSEMMA